MEERFQYQGFFCRHFLETRSQVDVYKRQALLGTAGVTVGLALQGGLANLAGGVLLLLFKPFVVGDYIIQDQSNGCEGTVAKIEICYTTLLSLSLIHIKCHNYLR